LVLLTNLGKKQQQKNDQDFILKEMAGENRPS